MTNVIRQGTLEACFGTTLRLSRYKRIMKSIQAVYKKLRTEDDTLSDFIIFSRSVSGRKFCTGSISSNYRSLVSTSDGDTTCRPALIRHLTNISKNGPVHETKNQKGSFVRSSKKYGRWRIGVLLRDNHTCCLCGETPKQPEVDHITPLSKIINDFNLNSLDDAYMCREVWDISNGRTLCKECHKRTPTYGRRYS